MKKIPKAVISRLPRYYRYLTELMQIGTERISSGDLAELLNTSASQVRQDLNLFGNISNI